ncbi:MAG: DeoR/GlpR family DNA-binding transcription regulator [Candidatus Fimivivens sp.]|nr:DeoR/GlpR family DNA-binding transcription regulator [Candidatus Fimivivens sp.]
MIKEERLVQILSIINEKKFITAEELENLLYVSLSTVRRDLAELNRRGLIIRSQGGAIVKSEAESTDTIAMVTDPLSAAKTAIAKRASEMVNDGDVIFMSASSTVLLMARFLREKRNITVVTNSLQAVSLLSEYDISVYGCGGKFIEHSNALCGNSAVEFIDGFNYDATFFSCTAISPLGDICTDPKFVPVLKASLLRSKKRVCLCDGSKFEKAALHNTLTANQIDFLITDSVAYPRSFAQKVMRV